LILRRLRRFRRLPADRRRLLIEATFELAYARIALLVVPFRVLAARLGTFLPPAAQEVRTALAFTSPDHASLAAEIGWAVTRAARYAPFRAVCLPQAIAAKRMLARRDVRSILHFGAAKGATAEKPLDAHAWLDAAGVEVTGYPVAREFSEIACFV
jgi:hypothetical protein